MDTPGYDPVSATGQVAGGANLICFTTGRGSAYGCAPSPSLKLATNSALWQRRRRTWTSTAARSSTAGSIQAMGQRIFELVLATPRASCPRASSTATGKRVRALASWRGDVTPSGTFPCQTHISAPDLTARVATIFTAAGSSAEEAQTVAANLVLANLSGHDSHGVGMVPRYIDAVPKAA
jgi:hypothetical protein